MAQARAIKPGAWVQIRFADGPNEWALVLDVPTGSDRRQKYLDFQVLVAHCGPRDARYMVTSRIQNDQIVQVGDLWVAPTMPAVFGEVDADVQAEGACLATLLGNEVGVKLTPKDYANWLEIEDSASYAKFDNAVRCAFGTQLYAKASRAARLDTVLHRFFGLPMNGDIAERDLADSIIWSNNSTF